MPVADKIIGTEFAHFYNLIGLMVEWPRSEILSWQDQKLRELIAHAYNNTAYYKTLMRAAGMSPDDIQTISDLKKLPVLKKETLNNNFYEFVPRNLNKIRYKESATGGTSGDPLKFLLDYRAKSFTTASTMFNWQKVGYHYGDKYIALGSHSLMTNYELPLKYKFYNALRRRIPLNGINLSNEVLVSYVRLIKERNVRFIYGYASAIFLLAQYILETGIKIKHIQACFTTSEMLLENYRNVIRLAFDCEILDCYGASDGGVMAFKKNDDEYFVSYNSILETHDDFESSTGKLLCTDLFNYAMPFIRYEIGDVVKLKDYKESTGYNGQVIQKVYGRSSDVFRLGNGRVLTGPGFTVLFRDKNVNAYRMKLIDPFTILIELKKNRQYSAANENDILSALKKQAGDDCKIIISHVKDFSKHPNGKMNYFLT